MPPRGYKNICIPENLYYGLQKAVDREGSYYTSVSALAQEALREKIGRRGDIK